MHICVFNDTATTESYTYWHTLSLHDALPISTPRPSRACRGAPPRSDASRPWTCDRSSTAVSALGRSEEHTSELQSLMRISYAVFCLKKKTTNHRLSTCLISNLLRY